MKGQQERSGRALAAAIRAIEFDVRLTDARNVDADVVAAGVGGARIEVRHPDETSTGRKLLVGVVSLERSKPELVYAVPLYRDALARVVARADGGAR